MREPRAAPRPHDRAASASRRTAEAVLEAIHEVRPAAHVHRPAPGRPGPPGLRAQGARPVRCPLRRVPDGGRPTPRWSTASTLRSTTRATSSCPLRARMLEVASDGRFERAGELRQRLHALARTLEEHRRLAALADVEHLVAARRCPGSDDRPTSVEVVVVARGRLDGHGTRPVDDGRPIDAIAAARPRRTDARRRGRRRPARRRGTPAGAGVARPARRPTRRDHRGLGRTARRRARARRDPRRGTPRRPSGPPRPTSSSTGAKVPARREDATASGAADDAQTSSNQGLQASGSSPRCPALARARSTRTR